MNLLIRVFGCEMAVNSTRVDRPQRMTSPLVEDGFSGTMVVVVMMMMMMMIVIVIYIISYYYIYIIIYIHTVILLTACGATKLWRSY